MRIGIDGSCWSNRRGVGRFTRCLVEEMAALDSGHRLVLFIDEPSGRDAQLPGCLEVQTVPVGEAPATAASAAGRRSVRDVIRMSRAASRAGCDIFFFPSSYSYYPVFGRPVVVTFHDTIAELIPHLLLPTRRSRLFWRAKRRLALRQARTILTVSEASRQALMTEFGLAEDRIRVVGEAPAARFRPTHDPDVLRRYGIGSEHRYFLYVGGISPHKNLPALVEAFGLVGADDASLHLLIVGDTERDSFHSDLQAVRRAIASSPAVGRIQLAGFVEDDDLPALYTGAVATVLPSLGEGFGLVPAESAACGTPVVASTEPALMELLGDAGLYTDAQDVSGLAAHLKLLLSDPALRGRKARAVTARAESWSWHTTASRTIAALEEAGSARA